MTNLYNKPYYENENRKAKLFHADCLELLPTFPENSIDMIYADPPYFLSNGGITCHAGRMVSVNKGEWDKSCGTKKDHEFALRWLSECQRVLKDDGTIWVSGTMHNIYSIGFAMQELGYKLLNEICWFKPNASPNLSCRYFTHSHETLVWAAKCGEGKHKFNYHAMKDIAGGKQMRSVWIDVSQNLESEDIWTITTPGIDEKKFGKHPTQKPIMLLDRIIKASTCTGDIVLDPFTGSSTTGIAAIRNHRAFIGIDTRLEFLELSVKRFEADMAKCELELST